MAQNTRGIRAVLSHPTIYSLFQTIMGAHEVRDFFVKEFVRPEIGDKVLDVGCGPADILDYMPDINYWGFDISEPYIKKARDQFGDRGQFRCKMVTEAELSNLPAFDVVLAIGLLHHLDDIEAQELLALLHSTLRTGGRLLTLDPCIEANQNIISRFLVLRDRGQNVRTKKGYSLLAEQAFDVSRVEVRHKRWIPYTHCFMEIVR